MADTQSTPFLNELREAFHGPGCAFCRSLDKHADKFVDSILWEMVNDPGTRIELNQARGYCNQHAWLLVRGGAALGTAILMNDVVKTLLKVADERQLGFDRGWICTKMLRQEEKPKSHGEGFENALQLPQQRRAGERGKRCSREPRERREGDGN